jgi:hypothetical protein
MIDYSRKLVATLAACAILAACGREATTDTATTRQVELAPPNPAPPALSDAPVQKAAPAPVTKVSQPRVTPPVSPPVAEAKASEKKAAPPPVVEPTPTSASAGKVPTPSPTTGAIAAGTTFAVKPETKICSNTHKIGDQFSATLTAPMQGSNNVEVPAGAIAMLRIVESKGESKGDSAHLSYEIISLRSGENTYEVNGHVTESAPLERVKSQSNTDVAKKVGIGAVIGAVAGRVIGGNTKGAVIGGAVGAAAGAAVAVRDNKVEGCLKQDGTITLALDRPLIVKLPAAP